MTNYAIDQAVLSAKQGDRAAARAQLSQVVRREPDNIRAWYLLSQVVEDPAQAKYCLEMVVKLDPSNEQAIHRLAAVVAGQQPIKAPAQPVKAPVQKKPKAAKKSWWFEIIASILILMMLGVLVFMYFWFNQKEPEGPVLGSRANPIPYGETAYLVRSHEDIRMNYDVKVIASARGPNVWKIVYNANQFNDPARPGTEFIMVKVQVNHTGQDNSSLDLNYLDFGIISRGQVFSYQDASVCCTSLIGYPELQANILSGGSTEGWIFGLVYVDDPSPQLVLGRNQVSEGVFFALTK